MNIACGWLCGWAIAVSGATWCISPACADTLPPADSSETDELPREGAPPTKLPVAEPPSITPAELESAGVVIGEIIIINGDVFDTDLPEENNLLFRLANKLHIETQPEIVRSQLLFKPGDRYSARLVRESERILRRNDYLFDARITPARVHDGKVDLIVRTKDVWTLKPGISYGRSGGEDSTGFEFEESNLLGRGKEFELAYTKDVDRETKRVRYFDPHLAGTWNRLGVQYEDNSDGELREFSFDRPFYSLEAQRAAGVGFTDWNRVDSRYNLGEVVDKYRHVEEKVEVFGGWSSGLTNDWVRRLVFGAAYEHDGFESVADPLSAAILPGSRTLAYPYMDIEFLQDAFEERRNQDQIERTEDFYAGTFLTARVGYAAEALGSDRDAIILGMAAGTTFESEERRHTLLLETEGEARIEDGDPRNALFTAQARYYWRMAVRQLFYASLSGTVGENLDADQQILLGGDNGLRGYPLRYQDGSARALLTLEHRVYTKYYLFRLFHVGGAVFFDVGRTWGRGTVSGPTEKWLKDAGIGLRLGSSRSSFGSVIHMDLAFPFDGDSTIDDVQFLVETKRSF
ncbi:MAG: BamA/TamA family outer membrane protein [Steroidobacter sp.]